MGDSDKKKPRRRGPLSRPSIYAHHKYRAFLKDWVAYLKSAHRISLRELSRRAGLAAGTLPMFLSGKRALAADTLAKLLPHLELDAGEASYLRGLQLLAESAGPEERARMLGKLQRFHGYQSGNRPEFEVARYLSHWYYVAIREMAVWPDFEPTAEWILPRLLHPASSAQIETALAFLLEHGFIEKSADGKVSVAVKPLKCDSGVYRLSLARFHREMLEITSRSIESVPREERLVLGHTSSFPPERFEEAKRILERAQKELEALSTGDATEGTVYHVSLSAVPLTTRKPGKKGS